MTLTADKKDAFICYRSYIEAIRLLPEDKRWGFFQKLFSYALDETPPEFSEDMESAMFTLMKANIDSCNKRYKVSAESGKKGGAPCGNKNAKKQPKQPEKQPKNNLNKNDNVNDNSYSVSEVGVPNGPTPSTHGRNELTPEQIAMGWKPVVE